MRSGASSWGPTTVPSDISPLVIRLSQPGVGSADTFDGTPKDYVAVYDNRVLGPAKLPWNELSKGMASLVDPDPPELVRKHLGDALRRFLVDVHKDSTQTWRSYEGALAAADPQRPVVLNLRLAAVELFAAPWELVRLESDGCPLGDLPGCVIQYEWDRIGPVGTSPGPAGRLLFAWSDAGDPVPADEHRAALLEAVPGFQPERDELEDASLDTLLDKLQEADREGHPFRMLHLLCHGVEVEGGAFGLKLHSPNPRGVAGGLDLAGVLQRHKRQIQCVVLNACHGSHPGPPFLGKVFGGVAHDVHRRGIPAVIASRAPLSVNGSITLTRELYKVLYGGRALTEAFCAARGALSYSFHDRMALQLLMASPDRVFASTPELRRVTFPGPPPLPRLKRGEDLAVLAEVNATITDADVLEALGGQLGEAPEVSVLCPLGRVGTALPSTKAEWKQCFKQADELSDELENAVDSAGTRTIHLFGNAPLPLMFHLGYRLSYRRLRVYQKHKNLENAWSLGHDHALRPGPGPAFFEPHWPEPDVLRAAKGRVAVTVEVTNDVTGPQLADWLGTDPASSTVVRLVAARRPDQHVVKGPADAARAWEELRDCLGRIFREAHQADEVWLALACPASFAAALGRAYNPNAQKPLVLFNFRPHEGYREVHRPLGSKGKRRSTPPCT